MKIITHLSGKSRKGRFTESRVTLPGVADEPKPGRMRLVSLGDEGLVFKCFEVRAAIPLSELWKLAEKHEPGLRP